jgi:hypothetical protein
MSNLLNNGNLGSESQEIVDALIYLGEHGFTLPTTSTISPASQVQIQESIKEAVILAKPIQVDQTDPNNVYLGFAPTGSATSAAVWLVQKVVTTGADIAILSANGSDAYNNIYDNRASLTYS